MIHENEIKESHREKHGDLLDSLTISCGSAAKGTAINVKVYFDATNEAQIQAKADGAMKMRGYLKSLGMQL